jgi:NTE family protein
VHVTTGTLVHFDSFKQTIDPQHVMASGALPPGFTEVRIDGELYWDGGVYSNTPLDAVLDDTPRVNTLCFMVDLWSPSGPEPHSISEAQTRLRRLPTPAPLRTPHRGLSKDA